FFLAVTLFARRQIFRDSEIALRWFSKVWQHPSVLQTSPTMPTPSSTPSSLSKTQPVAESKNTSTINNSSGNSSTADRPLVQKTNDVVSFKPAKSAEDENDFELAIA
ncbi:MAG: hypothetical protein LBI18_00720, partial [Planctomycetaceae bacterium]|nr:hypothetical protein [Planctomycetaceae bacterium]